MNQRICVALNLESTGKTLTTDQVRQIVLRDFRNWHGWESREDFDQLKDAVNKASSASEILRLVSDQPAACLALSSIRLVMPETNG